MFKGFPFQIHDWVESILSLLNGLVLSHFSHKWTDVNSKYLLLSAWQFLVRNIFGDNKLGFRKSISEISNFDSNYMKFRISNHKCNLRAYWLKKIFDFNKFWSNIRIYIGNFLSIYVMFWDIWFHLYHLKNVKIPMEEWYLLFTKSNTFP